MLGNMMSMIPMPCDQKRVVSAVAAAAMYHYYPGGMTIMGQSLSATQLAMVAAVGVDLMCRGGDIGSGAKELAVSAAIGGASGTAMSMAMRH